MPKVPTVEDMLIAYATIPGYVANRDNMRGTWFIESICKVFMKNAADMDIKEMMDEVNCVHPCCYYGVPDSIKGSPPKNTDLYISIICRLVMKCEIMKVNSEQNKAALTK